MRSHRSGVSIGTTLLLAAVLAGSCSSEDSPTNSAGEVVLTCASCAPKASDAFQQYKNALALRFNEEFDGEYEIKILPNVGEGEEAAEAFRRLALAGDLPDLMALPGGLVEQLSKSAEFMNFESYFEEEEEFKDTFHEGLLGVGEAGRLLVPEERSIAGVFYNSEVLKDGGVAEPPTDWDEFESMAKSVSSAGSIPLAVDGLWVTLLWLTHLIGTQDGGADYLNELLQSGDAAEEDLADSELWVQAVGFLRDLHAEGFVNEDAYTGDFQRANAPYSTGEAASIVNGPWQTDLIEDPEVLENTVNVPAPGDGLIVFSGGGGWASTAESSEQQEAVWAFIKFAYSWEEQVRRTLATGSYPPVAGEFSDEERAELNPINVGLLDATEDVANSYPSIVHIFPEEFQAAWRNYWPAYVQDDLDTGEFLTKLTESLSK